MNTVRLPLTLGAIAVALVCSLAIANAQTNALAANPPDLTFINQGGVNPAPQSVLISSSSPVGVTATAFSDTNWLVVAPSSGTTPVSLTVSIAAGAPTVTDTGFISIVSAGGAQLTVPVTITAGASSTLTATPNSLSFNFAANSSVPATSTVSVSSNNASVTSFAATASTSNGGNWLTVFPAGGSVPGSFQVTANPATLGSGVFNAAIAINPPGTTGIVVPVLVTVAGTPALNVSPGQLSFAYQVGTSTPAAQTLSLTSSTGSNISFTASSNTSTCGSNWLVISPTTGATPSSLSVQVNTSGLTPGNCAGEVDISASGVSNATVKIPVALLVSTNPLLLVPSVGPTFNYQLGSAAPPAAQSVQITSSGAALNIAASVTAANGSPTFVTVTPATGTTPQSLALSLNAATLASIGPGTYNNTVVVSSAGAGNSPQSFPVTLVVSSNPVLLASVQSLNFNYEIGQASPSNQTFTVSSTGAPLNYQVSASTTNCNGFLSATPANASTYGSQNQVVVSVTTTGLTTAQTCNGNITITVPGSTTPPFVIPVTLNASATPLVNVSQSTISVTALIGSAATLQTVAVTSTDPNTQLAFSAVAATNPIGLTWLSVTPNSGNTPSNLQITINPASLAAGVYAGTITVTSSAPNVPAQIVNVTLTVVSSNATATPAAGLVFTESVGGAVPPSQTVQIGGVPAGVTIGALATLLNGSGWLTASVAANVVTVAANGTQLPPGSYAGVVTVIVPGAGNSPLYVPVTLNVGAAPTLSLSSNVANFAFQQGTSTTPPSVSIQATSTGGSVPFTATFASNKGGAFATVTPASGSTPANLTIAFNAAVVAGLAAGSYTGTVTVSSPTIAGGNQIITVNLTVTAAATPLITSVKNGASFQATGSVAPGEIISIFGIGVGPANPPQGISFALTASGTVPTTLGNVSVTFNGVAAPLLFVSATQVNAIVPYEMASATNANVVVSLDGTPSLSFPLQIVSTSAAIFATSQNGSGQGAILNQDSTVNNLGNPAAKNSVVQIFGTGEGQIKPAGLTGCVTSATPPFSLLVATPVTVTIGGQPASIQYSGEAPGLVCGVVQVNARVPTTIGSGPQPVVLTIGNSANNQQIITVAVQ